MTKLRESIHPCDKKQKISSCTEWLPFRAALQGYTNAAPAPLQGGLGVLLCSCCSYERLGSPQTEQ